MGNVGGRRSVVMMESLEGRQLLSFDEGGAAPVESESGEYSTLNVGETVAVPTTTTTLVLPSGVVEEGAPVTLEAVVGSDNGEAVTGRVAFLLRSDLSGYAYKAYANLASVGVWLAGAMGQPQTGALLGTSDVGSDGKARLTIDSLPVGNAMLPVHRIVAVYLGNEPVIVPVPHAWSSSPLVVTETPQALPSGETVFDTGGRPFRIQYGQVQLLSETPTAAHVVADNGVKVTYRIESVGHAPSGSNWHNYAPAVDFAPVDQAVMYRKGSAGNDFELVPVGVPASVRMGSTAWGSSVSDAGTLQVKAATSVVVRVHGQTTLTNPPALTATIFRPSGKRLSVRWAAAPRERGSILSNKAGLTVRVPSSPSESNGYGTGNYGLRDVGYFAVNFHNTVTITAAVSRREPPPRPILSGSVTFYDGKTALATVSLDTLGTAKFVPTSRSLALGGHRIRAVYSGDAGHRPDQSDAVAIKVTKTPTVVLLNAKQTVVEPGGHLGLTAIVKTAVPDFVKPTGWVVFYANGAKIGKVELGSDEKIQLDLKAGTYELKAVYRGADTLRGATSSPTLITVKKARKS